MFPFADVIMFILSFLILGRVGLRRYRLRRWVLHTIIIVAVLTMTLSVITDNVIYNTDDFLLFTLQDIPGRPDFPTDGKCEGSNNPFCLRVPLDTMLEPVTCDSPDRPVTLLLMTTSTAKSRERRNLHRKYYSALAPYNIRRVFLLGQTEDPLLQGDIVREAKEHGDILQWDVPETYRNIVLKTIMAYKWFNDTCRHVKYYMKTDDDVVINFPAMLQFIRDQNLHKPFLMGNCVFNRTVRRNQKLSRHYIRYEQYGKDSFPPFCEGSGYIMPEKVPRSLAAASFNIPVFPIEDSFTGTAIASLNYPVSIEDHQNEFSADYWFLVASSVCDRLRKGKLFTAHCPGGKQLEEAMHCALNSTLGALWSHGTLGISTKLALVFYP